MSAIFTDIGDGFIAPPGGATSTPSMNSAISMCGSRTASHDDCGDCDPAVEMAAKQLQLT
jgi:hypothetical protein